MISFKQITQLYSTNIGFVQSHVSTLSANTIEPCSKTQNLLCFSKLAICLLLLLSFGCSPDKTSPPDTTLESKKQIWVYKHQNREGTDYTLFSIKKPLNKGVLPEDFLAIRNKKRGRWNCLLKWEGETLWFYTPSTRSFASHNSESGKTKWTIIEEKDFNHFFYNEENKGYIRFSSHCGQPEVHCLDAEEIVISE